MFVELKPKHNPMIKIATFNLENLFISPNDDNIGNGCY
jgi:hypothetical protein